jgi:metallo-beta-lactamase class B
MRSVLSLLVIVCFTFALLIRNNTSAQNDWTERFPAFRIAGNLYYVGSKGLASYLVTTSEGHVLINSNLEAGVPLIRKSVESLGFKFSDIKILLISHAHWDHNAGSALIKELTGAKYMIMDADVEAVESGGKTDFHYRNDPDTLYKPTKVDRVLHDREEVKLGGSVLTAHLTPGHTKGCTTWTMQVQEGPKTFNAVIVGSPNVNPGYKLVGNEVYPRITEDYEKTFRVLKSLPCDIFLGAHGSYFDMEKKYERLKLNEATAFFDPAGYKNYVSDREQAFRLELQKQRGTVKVATDEAEKSNHPRHPWLKLTSDPEFRVPRVASVTLAIPASPDSRPRRG